MKAAKREPQPTAITMAEAVGLVASVIGIAGLAGRIAKAGYKVASLLEEMHNVPEELQQYLL